MAEQEENYSEMSTEKLKELYAEYSKEAEVYNVSQLVKKILLNSLYGAMGSPYFSLYNVNIARAITLCGQCLINKSAKAKNDYISKVLNEKTPKDRRIYSDTDSVTGDTLIVINGEKVCIEDFYNTSDGYLVESYDSKDVKELMPGYKTNTVDDTVSNEKETDVRYVMRHKTHKHMYRIWINDKYVDVTEDHSVMFVRDGELMAGTVLDIQPTDKLVAIV